MTDFPTSPGKDGQVMVLRDGKWCWEDPPVTAGSVTAVDQDEEREQLHEALITAVETGFSAVSGMEDIEEGVRDTAASMAATCVIRRLRVMSARQLAVLLAEEPNRHETWPP